MMNKERRFIDFLILFAIIFFVYRGWFRPGIIARGDFTAFSKSWMLDYFSLPSAWTNFYGGGRWTVPFGSLAHYPFWFFQGFFTWLLKLDFGVVERILWFYPFLLISVFSIYYLAEVLFRKRSISFVATLFYLVNGLIIWRAHCGQMASLMAYALTPLALIFFIKARRESWVRNSLLTGLIVAIITVYEFRLALLAVVFILFFAFYFFLQEKSRSGKLIASLAIICTVVIWLHAFWLLSLVLVRQEGNLIPETMRGYSLSMLNFLHILALSSSQEGYRWGEMLLLSEQVFRPALCLIPVLVFLPFLFRERRRDPLVRYLVILTLVFIFLAKGARAPFGNINRWIYKNIPLFAPFKVPIKFMYSQALCYALLLGISAQSIGDRLVRRIRKRESLVRTGVIFFIALILLASIYPAILGKYSLVHNKGGSTFEPALPKGYLKMEEWLNQQPPGFSTMWLSTRPSYYLFSNSHPVFWLGPGGFLNCFSSYGEYFLEGEPALWQARSRRLSKILGLGSVKYFMVMPQDDKRWYWVGGEELFFELRDVIKRQEGLERIDLGDPNIYVYRSATALPRFYFPPESMLIVGDLNVLYPLSLLDIDFGDWGLFFSHQLGSKCSELIGHLSTLLFYGEDIEGLEKLGGEQELNQLLAEKKIIFLREADTDFVAAEGEWYSSQRPDQEASRGVLLATTSPQASIAGSFKTLYGRPFSLALRMAAGDLSGRIRITVNDEEVFNRKFNGEVSSELLWYETNPFHLKTPACRIIISKEGSGEFMLDKVMLYSAPGKDLQTLFATQDKIPVRWKMLTPTRYEVELKNHQPGFLIFTQNYHPLWRARMGEERFEPIIASHAVNSFLIDQIDAGKVTVEFTAQKYVKRGFYISLGGLFLIVCCLLVSLRQGRKR
jgi:hypothetical protein